MSGPSPEFIAYTAPQGLGVLSNAPAPSAESTSHAETWVMGRWPDDPDLVRIERVEPHEDPANRVAYWEAAPDGFIDVHAATMTVTTTYTRRTP